MKKLGKVINNNGYGFYGNSTSTGTGNKCLAIK